MGLKGSFTVAAALIICPIVALMGYKHWLDTRIVAPLDVPVSLSRGHVRTQSFVINLKGQYSVEVKPEPPFGYYADCPMYGPDSVLKARLSLGQRNRNLVLSRVGDLDYIRFFNVEEEGRYWLDLDVLSDASCLNAGHPRLVVESSGFGYYKDMYESAAWVCLVIVLVGMGFCGLFTVGAIRNGREETYAGLDPDPPRITAGSEPLRLASVKPISALPHFGLFCATVLVFVVFVMMILTDRIPPKGIYVSLTVRQPEPSDSRALVPPVLVRIQSNPDPLAPKVYVNSTAVEWDGLKEALKDELKLRPNWVVYVDGDSNLAWQYVMDVADVARELHAKVVLLTPETRKLVEPARMQKRATQ